MQLRVIVPPQEKVVEIIMDTEAHPKDMFPTHSMFSATTHNSLKRLSVANAKKHRSPIIFLTCLMFLFVVTRALMNDFKDDAIYWQQVELSFAGTDAHKYYLRTISQMARASNGMKKLRVAGKALQSFPDKCRRFLGTHASIPVIMFCSRLHDVAPNMEDPLTRASVEWLQNVRRAPGLTDDILATLYEFLESCASQRPSSC